MARRRLDWKNIIIAWQASGQTIAKWCQANNISKNTFYVWKKRYKSISLECPPTSSFVELKESRCETLTLEFQDIKIYLESNFDPSLLQKSLTALRNI